MGDVYKKSSISFSFCIVSYVLSLQSVKISFLYYWIYFLFIIIFIYWWRNKFFWEILQKKKSWHFLTPWIIQSSSSWLDLSHYPHQNFSYSLAIKYSSSSSSWKNILVRFRKLKKKNFNLRWVGGWGGGCCVKKNIVVVDEMRKKYQKKIKIMKKVGKFPFGRFIRWFLFVYLHTSFILFYGREEKFTLQW